ncbi:MAG: hypothetical protein GXP58_01190 [Deltaproteobacteria bacterium]|nr:hypothetical protein [Deltaproteobacteria bacterium]
MGNQNRLQIQCPSCNTEIIIDPITGQVLYHEEAKSEKESPKEKSMQELLRELEEKKKKSASRFEEEKEALRNRRALLEKKFKEIKKHVDTSDPGRPPHPFDYD